MDPLSNLIMNSTRFGHLLPHLPREAYIENFEQAIKQTKQLKINLPYTLLTCTDLSQTKPNYSSRRPAELKEIHIRDMELGKVHMGYFLRARIFTEIYIISAVAMLIEDERNDATRFCIYNYPASRSELKKIFSIGARLIIIEPYFKLASDGLPCIRVDNPGDLIIDRSMDYAGISFGAEAIKEIGNQAFKNGSYDVAFDIYDQALTVIANDSVREAKQIKAILYGNQAECHLKMARFGSAIRCAHLSLENDSSNEKTKYRLARAFMLNGNFNDSLNAIANVTNSQFREELTTQLSNFKGQVRGQFNWAKIISSWLSAAIRPRKRLDITPSPLVFEMIDYTNPKLQVRKSKLGCMGVFASEEIQSGELLCVSRPLGFVPSAQSMKELMDMIKSFNLDMGRMTQLTKKNLYLHARILNNLVRDYSLIEEITKLFDGTNGNKVVADRRKLESKEISIETLKDIIKFNSFGTSGGIQNLISREYRMHYELHEKGYKLDTFISQIYSTGLYKFPSYFNHSCLSNAAYFLLDAIMIIRAIKNIPKEEEITVSYTSPENTLENRRKVFESFEFRCVCKLCTNESKRKSNSFFQKSSEFEHLFQQSQDNPLLLSENTQKMKQLYETETPSNQHRLAYDLAYNFFLLKERDEYAKVMFSTLENMLQLFGTQDPNENLLGTITDIISG